MRVTGPHLLTPSGAATNARLSRLAYDNGATSFLDVLDAERSLISAAQQLVQTRRALLARQVALYRALGGGAQALPDAPLLASPTLPASAAAPTAH